MKWNNYRLQAHVWKTVYLVTASLLRLWIYVLYVLFDDFLQNKVQSCGVLSFKGPFFVILTRRLEKITNEKKFVIQHFLKRDILFYILRNCILNLIRRRFKRKIWNLHFNIIKRNYISYITDRSDYLLPNKSKK